MDGFEFNPTISINGVTFDIKRATATIFTFNGAESCEANVIDLDRTANSISEQSLSQFVFSNA